MHVEMTRARVMNVARQHALEHLVQAFDVRVVDVARATAWLHQKQRVAIQRGDLQVLRVLRHQLSHGVRVRAILLPSLLRVEVLDVADRHRVDQCALLGVSVRLEADRLLNGGVREWRFLGVHRRVEVRPPGPCLTPVTNRAIGVSLPGLAK